MGYEIIQNIVVPDGLSHGYNGSQPPFRQVHAHSTGNRTATMQNEINYLANHAGEANYTHLVGIEDGKVRIYQVANVNQSAFDVGGDWNLETYAAVELSEGSIQSQEDFNKAYPAYVWLLRELGRAAGTNYTLDDATVANPTGIITHDYATYHQPNNISDHIDPLPFLALWGVSYEQFANDVKNGLDDDNFDSSSTSHQPDKQVGPDQILEVGSTVRIDGIFSLYDLVPYNGGYYAVSTPLLIPKVDYHNYIPVGPLTETDDKGNATADQDFSNAGHSYFVFGGQEFKVSDVDVDSDAVEVQIGGEPVWMPAGPLTEVQN
ncbi:N-acetylmuramoyl-L-alanine amidase [Leuconostoc citreum]|uniref:N-acetylmuramoyl-L-alanine amidase n=1 Tax=Leuconostoc citreum TaxID=33964 RepID=UPI0032E028DF